MLTTIGYDLPDTGTETQKAFKSLSALLDGGYQSIRLAPIQGLQPTTFFSQQSSISNARILLSAHNRTLTLPASFFPDFSRASAALSLTEAAERLTGSIMRVDHTGIIVPSNLPASDWQRMANFLARNTAFYNYPPNVDGYDPQTMRWFFVIPATQEECLTTIPLARRQPKFEVVWDAKVHEPVVQIDMETKLSRQEIINLFPGDESFDIPGLEPFFRSVNIASPWPGLRNFRFDLRYATENPDAITPWSSANFFVTEGERITPYTAIRRLPKITLG